MNGWMDDRWMNGWMDDGQPKGQMDRLEPDCWYAISVRIGLPLNLACVSKKKVIASVNLTVEKVDQSVKYSGDYFQ